MWVSEGHLANALWSQPREQVKTELCGRIFVEVANYRGEGQC